MSASKLTSACIFLGLVMLFTFPLTLLFIRPGMSIYPFLMPKSLPFQSKSPLTFIDFTSNFCCKSLSRNDLARSVFFISASSFTLACSLSGFVIFLMLPLTLALICPGMSTCAFLMSRLRVLPSMLPFTLIGCLLGMFLKSLASDGIAVVTSFISTEALVFSLTLPVGSPFNRLMSALPSSSIELFLVLTAKLLSWMSWLLTFTLPCASLISSPQRSVADKFFTLTETTLFWL